MRLTDAFIHFKMCRSNASCHCFFSLFKFWVHGDFFRSLSCGVTTEMNSKIIGKWYVLLIMCKACFRKGRKMLSYVTLYASGAAGDQDCVFCFVSSLSLPSIFLLLFSYSPCHLFHFFTIHLRNNNGKNRPSPKKTGRRKRLKGPEAEY